MKKKKGGIFSKKSDNLTTWQKRLQQNKDAYADQLGKMDNREELYKGTKAIVGISGKKVEGGNVKPATHVRNVVAEIIESQVSSNIPQPKVTAMRPEDEQKARLIEDMIRNELDRLKFEAMNDQQERTCPIQGGSLFLVEWDNSKRTNNSIGELTVTDIHPKKFIPQDGVFSGVEDMDYCFLLVPQTKQYIKRKYGIDVEDERESEPENKGSRDAETAEDMVTQCIVYYRNEDGGIGLYSWVNDTELEDLPDYQARKLKRCTKCDMPGDGKECRFCGSKSFSETTEDYEELYEDIPLSSGEVIPAMTESLDEYGMPIVEEGLDAMGEPMNTPVYENTKLPFYKPDVFPVVLRKNVSVFGQFLGDSDVDKIADQQNTIKKLSTKIGEKLLKGGSYITLPESASIDKSDKELKIITVKNPADKQLIGVYNMQVDVSGDMAYASHVYEEARQIIGITDSFQGRKDSTATSGKAKEFSAAQAAGRLESKRIMKDAAYADLFEIMFKFKLAYADEPRPVVSTDNQGSKKYESFNRYDFLEKDDTGTWQWNDKFLFSCDTSATLASNREGMWQETRLNYQEGAYGQTNLTQTLVVFWTRMEQLHYPGASDTRSYFESVLKQEKAQALALQQQQLKLQLEQPNNQQLTNRQVGGVM